MERINVHRLFGLFLADFFAGSPYVVESEKDLSIKKQLLDVVIIRKGKGQFTKALPDGLEHLATHNLITFKSHHESLDDWALKELTGHYVNYRKQVSPSFDSLLPEDEFRLYAICSRFPRSLSANIPLVQLRDGVYECRRATDAIRIIVAVELPETENNSLLKLWSASQEGFQFGAAHYQRHSSATSTLIDQLLRAYRGEGLDMPYTLEDFRRDYLKEHIAELPPEARLAGLTPEQRLAGLSPDQLLAGLTPAQIEKVMKRRKQEEVAPKRKKKK